MEQLLFSLNATIPVFLVMVLGYFLKNIKMLDEPFVDTLNKFNYKVTLPFLVFKDIASADFYSVWDSKYVMFCFLVTLASIIIMFGISPLLCKDKDMLGELVQGSYRSSAAVMGIAFIVNIYGNSGMAPLMIIGSVPLYNIAAVIILSFTGPAAKGMDKKAIKKALVGIITNPIILGILFGLISAILRIDYPVIIDKSVASMAALASPLALIGLGASFEGRKALKHIFPTTVVTLVKLVVWPCIFLPIAIKLGFTTEKLVAILIMLGSPTTPSCYIMAKNLGHKGTLTSSAVVTTTFLSSFTITFFLFVLRSMGLI